jgi:hypothetical protein
MGSCQLPVAGGQLTIVFLLTGHCQLERPALALRLLDRIPNKREFLARSLGALGVFRLLERISTRRRPALVILTYHRIGFPGIGSTPTNEHVKTPIPEPLPNKVRYNPSR